jgi:isopenicillin N synthase-like dioxygenase
MMNDIKVIDVEEHRDGSATLQIECAPEIFAAIFNVGFVALVKAGLESERIKDVRSSD